MRINPFFLHGEELTPVRKLIALHALAGSVPLTEYTETGNPVTFETNVAKPLTECLVSFSPIQSGTGDPSPDNVRPITGWTGANVYLSPTGTDDPDKQTFAVTFPAQAGTVYGGTLDLATGVLTVKWAKLNVSDITFNLSSSGGFGFIQERLTGTPVYSNILSMKSNSQYSITQLGIADVLYHPNSTSNYKNTFYAYNPEYDNIDDFSAWFKETYADGYFIYALQTPLVYQLTPTEILSLIGTNVLWSDTNGDMEVKYLKKG